MLIGLATYIAGRRALPPEKPRTKAAKQQRAPFTPTEKRKSRDPGLPDPLCSPWR